MGRPKVAGSIVKTNHWRKITAGTKSAQCEIERGKWLSGKRDNLQVIDCQWFLWCEIEVKNMVLARKLHLIEVT